MMMLNGKHSHLEVFCTHICIYIYIYHTVCLTPISHPCVHHSLFFISNTHKHNACMYGWMYEFNANTNCMDTRTCTQLIATQKLCDRYCTIFYLSLRQKKIFVQMARIHTSIIYNVYINVEMYIQSLYNHSFI